MVEWEAKPRLLVGIAPEATQSHVEKKAPMGLQVKPGMVYLGQLAAEGHAIGDTVEILGKQFEIAHILPAHGRADEDIAIFMNLADAQAVLNKPGMISEILAIGCKCKTVERVEEITAQLETVLPDTKVTEHRLQAVAREDQRKLVEAHHAQTMQDYEANRTKIAQQEQSHRDQVAGLLSGVTSVATPLIVLSVRCGSGCWPGPMSANGERKSACSAPSANAPAVSPRCFWAKQFCWVRSEESPAACSVISLLAGWRPVCSKSPSRASRRRCSHPPAPSWEHRLSQRWPATCQHWPP